MDIFKNVLTPLTLRKFYPHLASLLGWKKNDSSYTLILNSSEDALYQSFSQVINKLIPQATINSITLSHVPPLTTCVKEFNTGSVLLGQLSPEWREDWGGSLIYQRQAIHANAGSFAHFTAPCKITEKGANQLCLPRINVFIELT